MKNWGHVPEINGDTYRFPPTQNNRGHVPFFTVIALADASGALSDRYVYTPYGVEAPLNTSGNPFRYTGRRYDPESELYYYRARYYWPEIGRFLQTDPIGYADQMNLYAYVANSPLNATDPSGMVGDDENSQRPPDVWLEDDDGNWNPFYVHERVVARDDECCFTETYLERGVDPQVAAVLAEAAPLPLMVTGLGGTYGFSQSGRAFIPGELLPVLRTPS